MIFDYQRSRMILEPNGDLDRPFPSNDLGVGWITGGRGRWHEITVDSVDEGSSGQAAGIQPGDALISFGDLPAQQLTLHELWRRTRTPGELRLVLRRGDRQLEISLVTGELV